jgi:methyl-accepting chemotaxis protein
MLGSLRRVVPRRIRRSYALKFAISLFVLGLVVLLIGGGATQVVKGGVEDNTLDRHQATARAEADAIERVHEQNIQFVNMAVETKLVREYEPGDEQQAADIEKYFDEWSNELPPYIQNLHFVRTDSGEVVASTALDPSQTGQATLDDFNVPESVDLSSVGDRGGYGTAPYQNPRGLPSMAYVRQTRGPEPYAVVYTVDMRAFSAAFQRQSVGSTASELVEQRTSVIVNQNNDIVATANRTWYKTDQYGERYDDTQGVLADARQVSASTGSAVKGGSPKTLSKAPYDFDADGYVVGWSKLQLPNSGIEYDESDDSGWILLVHTSEADAYGFVNTVEQYGIIATLLGVFLVVGLGAVIGRNTAASIDRLTEKAAAMEDGELDVEFETKRIDNIGRLYAGFASMRDALKAQIQESRKARMEAESERERVQQINDDLERAAVEYRDVMGKAANGDLTVRAQPETDHEAMETIGTEFNAMLDEIEHTVQELKRFAREVATASEEVTASSEEVKSASENVTRSTKKIAEGAERQNQSLQSANSEMSGLSTTIEEIAASSNEVADIAEQTAKTGKRGREAAKNALDAMAEVRTNATMAAEEIDELESEVEQIDELIEFITDIAEQTNMLALNANIEASRAQGGGEDGGGFGVVAQEVKELSEDTKEAAEDIEQRIESIRSQTRRSATTVERTSEDIVEQVDAVEEAAIALDEIADYAEQTNSGVQEISAATEQQAASTQEIVSMVDHAASISQKTANEVQHVASAAQQQTEALSEVSNGASDLAQQASQLSEALDRFRTQSGSAELSDIIDLDRTDDSDGALLDEDRAVLGAGTGDDSQSTFETPDVSLDDTEHNPATDGSGSREDQ